MPAASARLRETALTDPADRRRSPVPRQSTPAGPAGAVRRHRLPSHRTAAGWAALATAALLAGCGGGGRIGKFGDVRLVNATGGAEAIELYADGSRLTSGVGSGAAGGYAEVAAGTHALSLRLAGSGGQVAGASADIAKDARYTLLAYTSAGAVSSVLLGDDEPAPADGSARLRVFNAASSDAGALGAYLSPSGCSGLGASNAVAGSVTAAAVSAWSTVGASAAGTAYHLCITAAGDSSDLRLDLTPLTLASRQVKTVVLTATSGGVLVDGLVVEQQGAVQARPNTMARLRLVADAAGGAAVSASANGTTLASGAASPAVGTYLAVQAGALTADVRIGGAGVAVPALAAPAGADLTLLVAGSAAAPSIVLLGDDNRPSTALSAPSRLRLVNGINGFAATLALSADLLPVASGVAFPAASTAVNVASLAGASIQVTSAAGATPLYSLTAPLNLRSGVYTLFMLGDAAAPVGVLRPDRLTADAPSGAASAAGTGAAAR